MSRQTEIVRSEPRSLAQSGRSPAIAPACDIYENEDEILIVADLPGVTADALDIHLDNNELTLEAHRDVSVEHGSFLGAEYRECDFRRRFAVPGGIDANRISANVKEGVLNLRLPKSEALKPRQIAVRSE